MNKGAYYVVELLQSFTKKELKDLQAIANCSYFNTEKRVTTLLYTLIKEIEDAKSIAENSLISIYNAIYNTQLNTLSTAERSNLYAKMSRCFKKFIKAQRKTLQQNKLDADFFEHQFNVENSALGYAQLTGKLDKQNNIVLVKDSLTQYYLLQQLDLYLVELYLGESSIHHNVDHLFYEALKSILELPRFAENALLQVYQSIIKLMKTKTEVVFFKLIRDLDRHSTSIPFGSQLNFYNSLLNFCILQIRKGETAYNRHQFNLYQKMDEKNLLLINNQLHIGNLRNIINLSCRQKAYSWAVKMLDKYYPYLPNHLADAVKDFNLGTIAYYKKDYPKAIDYLFPLPTINLSHDINRRTIIIKAYYELDTEFKETTHTLFRSFEKYIREQKSLTSKSKTSYKNFIRTLINLYRIKHRVTKMKLENLKQKLETQKLNSNKSWLLEKIKELE